MKLSSVAITLCNSKDVICTHGKKSYVPYIWHWKVSKYQVIKKVDHPVTIVILFFLCILQVNYEVLFRINRNTNVQSKTMKKPTILNAIIVIIRLGRSVKKRISILNSMFLCCIWMLCTTYIWFTLCFEEKNVEVFNKFKYKLHKKEIKNLRLAKYSGQVYFFANNYF